MSDKLKPCSFCGHTPMVEDKKYNGYIGYRVKCACSINTGYYSVRGFAVQLWNQRKTG